MKTKGVIKRKIKTYLRIFVGLVQVQEYLKNNDVFDEDSFFELLMEKQ